MVSGVSLRRLLPCLCGTAFLRRFSLAKNALLLAVHKNLTFPSMEVRSVWRLLRSF